MPMPGIMSSAGVPFSATGGDVIATIGSYKYHIFTSGGTFTVTKGSKTVDIMCCGGGAVGGKGGGGAGGGGAGELKLFTATSVTPASHSVTIGAGSTAIKTNGGTTSIGSLLSALGGGYGGGWDGSGYAGGTGGSGGGAGNDAPGSPGSFSGSNTRAGGTGYSSAQYTGGGGGGATTTGQSGGAGGGGIGGLGYLLTTIDSNLTAANFSTVFTGMTYIASGGSGGSQAVNFTAPATGGGGSGGNNTGPIAAGNATSYGSGGGGGVGQGTNWGYGKSGIVIVRYTV